MPHLNLQISCVPHLWRSAVIRRYHMHKATRKTHTYWYRRPILLVISRCVHPFSVRVIVRIRLNCNRWQGDESMNSKTAANHFKNALVVSDFSSNLGMNFIFSYKERRQSDQLSFIVNKRSLSCGKWYGWRAQFLSLQSERSMLLGIWTGRKYGSEWFK